MKHGLTNTFATIVFGMAAMASGPAGAATGNGPYYATPSWDQTLPASTRFLVLTNMNNEAVLDRETGLVWEREPSASMSNLNIQSFNCMNLSKGGRAGWRLPSVQELMSLVDRSVPPPSLPSGHPFSVPTSSFYWSSTVTATPGVGIAVQFGSVQQIAGVTALSTSNGGGLAWCVRGGQTADGQ